MAGTSPPQPVDSRRRRASSDKKTAAAEKQYAPLKKLRDELSDFIEAVSQCAERGAPPTDPACPPRKADAAFRMDLDDGVMLNSAALWPLLTPSGTTQEMVETALPGRWEGLRLGPPRPPVLPRRDEGKCKDDPSLAVAHGCFWKYHPAKAYAWELWPRDEIRPDFTNDEADSDALRMRIPRGERRAGPRATGHRDAKPRAQGRKG